MKTNKKRLMGSEAVRVLSRTMFVLVFFYQIVLKMANVPLPSGIRGLHRSSKQLESTSGDVLKKLHEKTLPLNYRLSYESAYWKYVTGMS